MKTKIFAAFLSAVLLVACCITFAAGAGTAYTNDELCEMARQFCKVKGDHVPAYFTADDFDQNTVIIQMFDIINGHTATGDYYTIDRYTGKGTDVLGGAVDLSPYAPSRSPSIDGAFPFRDISSSSPYYQSIRYAYENGLLSGTSATEFSPDQPVDRAMMVTILHRLSGDTSQKSGAGYSDVAEGTYCFTPIAWASENGIANGTGGDIHAATFSPNAKVTNEQAAVMIHNYCVLYQGIDASSAGDLSSSQIGAYAREAVSWCVSHGLLPKAASAPKANATRAEVADAVYHLSQLTSSGAGGYRQVLDTLSSGAHSLKSVYYDINGDGVKELIAAYIPRVPGDEWERNQWAAVYTLQNGRAVQLIDKNWFKLLDAAAGELGVVEKDGKTYFCLHERNGGYTYPDMNWQGSYVLYEWSSAGWTEANKMTYRYTERSNKMVTSTCKAVLVSGGTSKNLDHSGYQAWLGSLVWKTKISV